MRHVTILLASTLALGDLGPADARPHTARCNISAYFLSGDHLDVRGGPSATARRLLARSEGSPVARIIGQSGAWFHVSTITDAESDATLFRGDGWVAVSQLGLDVANYDPLLYARPVRQSRALARLVPDQSRVTLLGCTGTWARVGAGRRTGWLSHGGQCSNPLTTCV